MRTCAAAGFWRNYETHRRGARWRSIAAGTKPRAEVTFSRARALWTPFSPEHDKIRLGLSRMRARALELPEIMVAEYYFGPYITGLPSDPSLFAPVPPPLPPYARNYSTTVCPSSHARFELCGIPCKYRTILRRIRTYPSAPPPTFLPPSCRSLIFRCIFNQP